MKHYNKVIKTMSKKKTEGWRFFLLWVWLFGTTALPLTIAAIAALLKAVK